MYVRGGGLLFSPHFDQGMTTILSLSLWLTMMMATRETGNWSAEISCA